MSAIARMLAAALSAVADEQEKQEKRQSVKAKGSGGGRSPFDVQGAADEIVANILRAQMRASGSDSGPGEAPGYHEDENGMFGSVGPGARANVAPPGQDFPGTMGPFGHELTGFLNIGHGSTQPGDQLDPGIYAGHTITRPNYDATWWERLQGPPQPGVFGS